MGRTSGAYLFRVEAQSVKCQYGDSKRDGLAPSDRSTSSAVAGPDCSHIEGLKRSDDERRSTIRCGAIAKITGIRGEVRNAPVLHEKLTSLVLGCLSCGTGHLEYVTASDVRGLVSS